MNANSRLFVGIQCFEFYLRCLGSHVGAFDCNWYSANAEKIVGKKLLVRSLFAIPIEYISFDEFTSDCINLAKINHKVKRK